MFSILLDLGGPQGPQKSNFEVVIRFLFSKTFLTPFKSVFWSGDMRFTRHGAVETHVGRFKQCSKNLPKRSHLEAQNLKKTEKDAP